MKTRTGFVSNSSSASFVVSRSALTELQIALIKNHALVDHILFPNRNECDNCYCDHNGIRITGWEIQDNGQHIRGDTDMDNFRMGDFLYRIGVEAHISHNG
jgi:hypothetical protein